MAFQPAPLVCQVNVRADLFTEKIENVLNFVLAANTLYTAQDVQDIAELTLAAWAANMCPVAGGNYVLREVTATALDSVGSPTFTAIPLNPIAGGAAGETLAGSQALVITHKTGLSGRSFRGRTYLAGLTESQVNGNFITAATETAISAAWAATFDAWTNAGHELCVVSRWSNKVLRTIATHAVVTATGITNTRVDTQRRRLPR